MLKRYIAFLMSLILMTLTLPLDVFAYHVKGKPGQSVTYRDGKFYTVSGSGSGEIEVSPDDVEEDADDISVSQLNQANLNEDNYYNQAYTSMVVLTIDSGGTLEQIELQLLRFAAIDKEEAVLEKISSLKSDITTVINNVETNATNNRSIFKTDNKDVLLGPLKSISDPSSLKNSAETSISGKYREALLVKANSISKLIDNLKSDTNLQYSATCYVLNTCQLLNEFSYVENSIVPSEINKLLTTPVSSGQTLIELKSKLESDGAKNLLSEINEDVFAEAESSFKATRLYQAFLQDISGEGDYYYTRELLAGKALSSAYIPLRTNVNNNPYLDIPDIDTFKSFNSTYGSLRKALMISTSNKSVSQMFITGQLNSFRPATLRDFIENVSDEKTFIVDAGYYNADTHEDHDWSGDERINFTLGSDEVSLESESSVEGTTEDDVEGTADEEVDANGEAINEGEDVYELSGKVIDDLDMTAEYSNKSFSTSGTPDIAELTYENLGSITPSNNKDGFIPLKGGTIVPPNTIIEDNVGGKSTYYIARKPDDDSKVEFLKTYNFSSELHDINEMVKQEGVFSPSDVFTNKYKLIKQNGEIDNSRLYTTQDFKSPRIISIPKQNYSTNVHPLYRTHWVNNQNRTEYASISFNHTVISNGFAVRRKVQENPEINYYYSCIDGIWYQITLNSEGKRVIGNAVTENIVPDVNSDGKIYGFECVNLDAVTEQALQSSASALQKAPEQETATPSTDEPIAVNGDGTVKGENIYKDAFGPTEVYADGYDDYMVHAVKEGFNAFTASANTGGSLDDAFLAWKNSCESVSPNYKKTWYQAYPGISNDKSRNNFGPTMIKSSFGWGDNNLIERFPNNNALDYLIAKANSDKDAESAIAFLYHWLGYSALTHTAGSDSVATQSNAFIPNILNSEKGIKIAIKYHFKTLNAGDTYSYSKIKAFATSLTSAIVYTGMVNSNTGGSWANTRGYLDKIRRVISELENEGEITKAQGDALYSDIAVNLGKVSMKYEENTKLEFVAEVVEVAALGAAAAVAIVGTGGAATVVVVGAAATAGSVDAYVQSCEISDTENFVSNINNVGSIIVYDANDIMWLFDDSECEALYSSDSLLMNEITRNSRTILRENILEKCKDPLIGISKGMENVIVQGKDTYDGNLLKSLTNTDAFLQTIGYTADLGAIDVQNAVAIIQAIFSTNISDHPGYTTFPESGRDALIEALPDNVKAAIKNCLEVKTFAQEVIDKLGAYTNLGELATDVVKALQEAKQKYDDTKSIEMDNTANSNDDLLKSNGTAAKLTANDVDAIASSIPPDAIREVFNTWYNKPNHFTLGLNPKEQATLLGSKLLRQDINLNVESNLDSSNNNFNSWYGIAFALDCMNHGNLADAVVGFENKPVFRSSPTAGSAAYQDAIFNYMLLSNIAESYPIRWDAVLDLDSPVFLDIYGNIVTESGLVIIPFAANSTLHKKVSILNSAFLHSYGSAKSFELDTNDINDTSKAIVDGEYYFSMHEAKVVNSISEYPAFSDAGLSDEESRILIPDEESKTWVINPIAINTDLGIISLNKIETTNLNAAKVLYTLTLSNYTDNLSSKSTENSFININSDISNILYQVMRGDRIENIDYAKEGLNTGNNYNPTIISQANKYENLIDELSELGTNSLISVPDITTMPGIEYIIFFIYKILLLLFVFYLLVQIYLATISQNFGVGTIGKIFVAFLCISVVVMSQPFIYKLSYYYTNRSLLQDEAELIAMLNREKVLNNVELGVVNARNAEKESKIMLKVTEVNVDFFGYLTHITDAATVGSLTEYYKTHIESDIETIVDAYEQRGSALYYDVEDLYDTSVITVDQSTNKLINVTKGSPAIAFRSPYYAILDYLIRNVNDYNALIDSYDYGLVSSGDGSIRTIGFTDRYFNSSAFGISRYDILHNSDKIPSNIDESILSFASYDRCGIFAMYGIDGIDNRSVWSEEDLTAMRNSAWYADNLPYQTEDNAEIEALSNYLDEEAINWVNSHKHMLGRISDETILKSLALHLSLAYNRYLGADGPKYFEIENISTNDILRVSTVAKNDVMTSSPFTFPKFILINAGLPGVYLSALLTMITFILSIVKPATTIITFLVLILSLILYRLLLNQKTEAIKGVIKYAFVLCAVNVSYSLILKFFMLLPAGIPTFVRILLLIIIHMLYIAAYVWLLSVVIFNWRDFGSNAFSNMVHMRSLNIKQISTEKINDNKDSGKNIYERLKDSDRWRNKHK